MKTKALVMKEPEIKEPVIKEPVIKEQKEPGQMEPGQKELAMTLEEIPKEIRKPQ